jgi:predicted membrane-bound mannosyltransferase/DNA-binding beta-propeller fold protein YncE
MVWRAADLNVEKTLYLLLIIAAVVTRFWALGDRGMSHDESLHAYYSWNLYKGAGFAHTPLMHGPFLFHINALIYSLFGANDFTARISVAVFGVALVGLPYFLRRWLGRGGALITACLLLISPSIWYHARYIRNESYVTVWGLLMLWGMFSYWRSGAAKWLYLLAAATTLLYATKEVSFIYAAIFGAFVLVVAFIELSRSRDFWKNIVLKTLLTALAVAVLVGAGIFITTLLQDAMQLGPGNAMPGPLPGAPPPPDASAQFQEIVQTLGGWSKLLLLTLIPGVLIGAGAYVIFKYLLPEEWRGSRAFDQVVIVGGISLFFLSPALLTLLNPLWQAIFRSLFVDVKFFESGNFPTNDVGPVARLAVTAAAFIAVSIALGLWWNRRRWLTALAISLGIGVTLFTTVFTNGVGLGTGYVGSLGYWLEQQGVVRGTQPMYYYFVITPIYEYFPIIISAIATVVYLTRALRNRRAGLQSAEPWDVRLFTPFLIWWTVGAWLAYSVAGERMPWLMVHIALPSVILSGRLLGEWLGSLDWQTMRAERYWLSALLLAAAIVSGAWLINNVWQALSDHRLDNLAAFSAWFAALVVFGASLGGLWAMKPRPTARGLLRLLGLMGLAVLIGLTVRTGWMWNFNTYDLALEYGVYAHGGPALKVAMKQIEELSQRTAGDKTIRIGFDADASWPFYWYLRDYPNKFQYSNSPSRSDLDAPLVLSSAATWNTVDAVLKRTHTYWQGHRIWWPMEDYKVFAECPLNELNPATGANDPVSAYDENGDGAVDAREKSNGQARCNANSLRRLPEYIGTLARWLLEPERRNALMDVFLNRDYTAYDRLRGGVHTPDNWPLVDDFRLYVKKDIASLIWTETAGTLQPVELQVDPYEKGWRDVAATQIIGSAGQQPGQLQSPQGIAVAPDGSIYVADSLNQRVQKFTPQGEFAVAFGGEAGSNMPGQFREPWDVAVAPDGTIYVADTWNHRVQHLSADGAYLRDWGTEGTTDGQAAGGEGIFFGPRGIDVDAGGRVLVADTGNKRIQVFNPDGSFLSQFGGGGLQPGQLDEPVGIDTNTQGEIVVADTWNGRMQTFNAQGVPLQAWDIDGWLDKAKVGKPYAAFDGEGRIYVADQVGLRILVFDANGQYLGSFGQYGNDQRGFGLPTGIDVDQAGNIYVADGVFGRILKFPPFEGTAPQPRTVPGDDLPLP